MSRLRMTASGAVSISVRITDIRFSASPGLRGWIGQFTGAAKVDRGLRPLRHPRRLHAGEALDWWRVEHIDRAHLLRLRADIPLPGRLWLELSVRDDGDGQSRYRQRTLFQPYGLAGDVFWTASGLFRGTVLGNASTSTLPPRSDCSRWFLKSPTPLLH